MEAYITQSILIDAETASKHSKSFEVMAKTSLAFYRKNQSLNDIENERPKSLAALREAIVNATSQVMLL